MKNINKRLVYIITSIFGILLIPSFLAAWGEDEGTLGEGLIWTTFAKLFHILRFPTHTLFWSLVTKTGAFVFFMGLVINCFIYGLLIERLIFIFKRVIKQQ